MPHPENLSVISLIVLGLMLAGLSALIIRRRNQRRLRIDPKAPATLLPASQPDLPCQYCGLTQADMEQILGQVLEFGRCHNRFGSNTTMSWFYNRRRQIRRTQGISRERMFNFFLHHSAQCQEHAEKIQQRRQRQASAATWRSRHGRIA